MEDSTEEIFYINYNGLVLKVQPQSEEGHVHFFVKFFKNTIEIFQQMNSSDNPYWHERGVGKSKIAFELGELIENVTM